MKPINYNRRGQTLIEALVALSIIVLGIVGVFALLNQALTINRGITDRYIASYLTAEGIEIIKNVIDTNHLQGLSWNSNLAAGEYEAAYDSVGVSPNENRFLGRDSVSELYNYSGSEVTNFKRRIVLSYPDCPGVSCEDHLKVESFVSGVIAGGGGIEVDAEDHFFNWF